MNKSDCYLFALALSIAGYWCALNCLWLGFVLTLWL